MRFLNDQPMFTPSGEKVGHVHRVVIDPRTSEVTHLVVRKGFLLTEDKVLPISLVENATPQRVIVNITENSIDKLPNYEETHYIAPQQQPAESQDEMVNSPERVRPVYWFPPPEASHTTFAGYPLHHPFIIEQVERNIPEDAIPLSEGANVYSREGEHIGDVERVLTDAESDQATHLLISQGMFFKEKRLIPMNWVKDIQEEKVQLATGANLLESLPEYHSM